MNGGGHVLCENVPIMSLVLVIAADPNIETLLGQLLVHAGHHPEYDPTLGAAGEAVRRTRPDVVMLDMELPRTVVHSCLAAAREAGSRVVLTSSSSSESELADEARRTDCHYFALPGGPNSLRALIRLALGNRGASPRVDSALFDTHGDTRADDHRLH